jgi:hypothetical protein
MRSAARVHVGIHQFARPSKRMNAGTSRARMTGKHGTSCWSVEGSITGDTIRREAGADNRPQGDRRATKVGVVIDFGRLFNRGHAA